MGLLARFLGIGKTNLQTVIDQGCLIIDVRTPEEFRHAHLASSVNIPLDTLPSKIDGLKSNEQPVITCCRSGARSARATKMLKQAGITSYNGGSWESLRGLTT
ncbi:rhodanese-like domain-containing protein [Dyadobacter sp.]|uniref:rhodanese-like domain-containing protein n=1 Tax=Dyadobacter sp. TaxID=1914288 RepID=UPI003F6ED00F